ncbi:UNVERIFIED_CONTAM: hypothetical protein Sradi_3196000 [Sesamum radiatum]|uniref:Reverse transcriptase RNase H-like domain-containing protein n=1 Tax=Sesamum radiatum TaxID=300843 RepID=A0AAW2RFC9_SESRA
MPAEWELSDDLPDEDILVIEITPPWKMYFDGASHKERASTGVVVTSKGEVLPYSFTLMQNCSNNVAEYQALIFGLLKREVVKSKRDWHERIGEALWAYRTTVRMPTQYTPYVLVYRVEAVLPLEQQIPSLRIAIQKGLTEEENTQIRLEELENLDEKRLEAQQRLECYQARLSRAFNKKVRLRSFQVGDLVLTVRRPIITTHQTENKFLLKWDSPYVV